MKAIQKFLLFATCFAGMNSAWAHADPTPAAHPFHVGISEIRLVDDAEGGGYTVQITHKLFRDDVEAARGEDLSLQDYIFSRFELWQNVREGEQIVPLQWVGFEYEDDVIWVYLEAKSPAVTRSWIAKNRLLFDEFSDQTHIIHWYTGARSGGATQTDLLTKTSDSSRFQRP